MKLYSIWIKQEDDNTFDINIWDEKEVERAEELEVSGILNYEQALEKLYSIIEQNKNIEFERLEDEIN